MSAMCNLLYSVIFCYIYTCMCESVCTYLSVKLFIDLSVSYGGIKCNGLSILNKRTKCVKSLKICFFLY